MNWYYAEGSQQRGPVSEAELDAKFQAGGIHSQTLVWREGMANWQPYGTARGTAPASAGTADLAGCPHCGRQVPRSEILPQAGQPMCAACRYGMDARRGEGSPAAGPLEYASFWARLGAKLIDGLILWGVNFAFALGFGLMAGKAGDVAGALLFQLFLVACSVAINLGYGCLFLGRFGATPGKMICQIKVVTADGAPLGYSRALVRCLAEILSGIICYVGYFMAAFDEERRALHDRLCETRVIVR